LLTDSDILSRLTNVEDATVERKVASDLRDAVKAAVAFSNSLPVTVPGIIYIGVYNDGRIEEQPINEAFLKKVSRELGNIYPPIYPEIHVKEKDGRNFVVVIVYGSPNKPHFAGQSYLRAGTQTILASDQQFEELVAKRNSKVGRVLE
jgi:predicted HTH transcriptional regulator